MAAASITDTQHAGRFLQNVNPIQCAEIVSRSNSRLLDPPEWCNQNVAHGLNSTLCEATYVSPVFAVDDIALCVFDPPEVAGDEGRCVASESFLCNTVPTQILQLAPTGRNASLQSHKTMSSAEPNMLSSGWPSLKIGLIPTSPPQQAPVPLPPVASTYPLSAPQVDYYFSSPAFSTCSPSAPPSPQHPPPARALRSSPPPLPPLTPGAVTVFRVTLSTIVEGTVETFDQDAHKQLISNQTGVPTDDIVITNVSAASVLVDSYAQVSTNAQAQQVQNDLAGGCSTQTLGNCQEEPGVVEIAVPSSSSPPSSSPLSWSPMNVPATNKDNYGKILVILLVCLGVFILALSALFAACVVLRPHCRVALHWRKRATPADVPTPNRRLPVERRRELLNALRLHMLKKSAAQQTAAKAAAPAPVDVEASVSLVAIHDMYSHEQPPPPP
uniref:Uncharacterized protein n=1 Tax=Chrysotila carterae TaxID=13221 RepID=A0A7S4BAB1_CHRCT